MAVTDWSTNAVLNISVNGVNIAEGTIPANLNNAIRYVMASVRSFYDSTYVVAGGDGGTITVQASGGAAPAAPGTNDIFIEYTP